ncbi:hypothetical protein GF312_07710 [Candidatus Poribacteria bacterium]|nr:hypothetical protein [Candidatus Poribacteria bacterium]
MIRWYSTLICMLIFLFLTGTAYSQEIPLAARLMLHGAYADNIFQIKDAQEDYVGITDLDLLYSLTPELSLGYSFSSSLFYENSSLTNYSNHLSFNYEKYINGDKGILNIDGEINNRQNTPEYDIYDRNLAGLMSDLSYSISDSMQGKFDYKLQYQDYMNLDKFSFLENYGSLQFSRFFESRTTLQLNANLGYRSYYNYSDEGNDKALQTTFILKIAQSIADLTGIQLKYIHHRIPIILDIEDNNEITEDKPVKDNIIFYRKNSPLRNRLNQRPIIRALIRLNQARLMLKGLFAEDMYETQGFYTVEDFLNNEYNYSSNGYNITLKHFASWGIKLEGSFSREIRKYQFNDQRDSNKVIMFNFEKEFIPNSFPAFTLNIQIYNRKNQSTLAIYDYSFSIFSLGTEFVF